MNIESNINIKQSEQVEYIGHHQQHHQHHQQHQNHQDHQYHEDTTVYYRPLDKARRLQALKLMVASGLLMGVIITFLFIFIWQYNIPQTHVAGVSQINEIQQETENQHSGQSSHQNGNQNDNQNGNQNGNQNSNTIEVDLNLNLPMMALPETGTILMNNPMVLNGYGQPGLSLQIVIDGNKSPITPISEKGEWSTSINLGEPGIHQLQMLILNQNHQIINVSNMVEVALLEPTLGEIIKEYPNLPSCGENIPQGSLASNLSMPEDSQIWVIPDEAYPILCIDESQNGGENSDTGVSGTPTNTEGNTKGQPSPIPVTEGKG